MAKPTKGEIDDVVRELRKAQEKVNDWEFDDQGNTDEADSIADSIDDAVSSAEAIDLSTEEEEEQEGEEEEGSKEDAN